MSWFLWVSFAVCRWHVPPLVSARKLKRCISVIFSRSCGATQLRVRLGLPLAIPCSSVFQVCIVYCACTFITKTGAWFARGFAPSLSIHHGRTHRIYQQTCLHSVPSFAAVGFECRHGVGRLASQQQTLTHGTLGLGFFRPPSLLVAQTGRKRGGNGVESSISEPLTAGCDSGNQTSSRPLLQNLGGSASSYQW